MVDKLKMVDPDLIEIPVPILVVKQPIGEMYIASLNNDVLQKISHFDVRRVIQEERDVERYLGIQRPLQEKRLKELYDYVNFVDATFPSSIILAINSDYVDVKDNEIILKNYREGEDAPSIMISTLARVLDGQHRIAGLEKFNGETFQVPVTMFVGSDISDQAHIFATVNLEQSKVRKSLAYDLFALSKSRSPQKVAHNIAVALDRSENGPFFKKIKRLGVTTPGRSSETLTQATFVEGVLSLISRYPKDDRDLLLRGKKPSFYEGKDFERYVLRGLFLDEKDMQLTATISNFFTAVMNRWPDAWNTNATGRVLNRTSGYRALIRYFRELYKQEIGIGNEVSIDHCLTILKHISIESDEFIPERFKPGSSGESDMFQLFMDETGLRR